MSKLQEQLHSNIVQGWVQKSSETFVLKTYFYFIHSKW